MTALLQRDEAARRAALDVAHSILLQAPAGSGKTTVLVCRVLALLAAGEDPEGILAISFSRKAAAEMRERIMHALSAPDDPGNPPALRALALAALERDRERRWDLLRNPARLRIQTFDALNQRLAAQAPVQSGSGASPAIAANPENAYARAARRALESAWQDPALARAAELLFEHLDNRWERFESLLAGLLAQRLQWLPPLMEHVATDLAAQVEHSLERLAGEAMRDALQRWPLLGERASAVIFATSADNLATQASAVELPTLAWCEQRAPLRAEHGELQRWRHACRVLLTISGTRKLRTSLTRREGIPTDDAAFKRGALEWLADAQSCDGLTESLLAVDALPDLPLSPESGVMLHALALLMRHAAAELQLEFVAAGAVDFSYLAGAARQSLSVASEPTDLALRFGAALRHLLVDEFQDTSAEQAALLAALTSDWSSGDGRTLFLVGDPMQSIYQFRAAEVGVFLQARSHGIGALPLQFLELRRNFRSGPGVVDWINRRIGPLFPARDDLRAAAISFLDSASGKQQLEAKVSVCAALQSGDNARDSAAEAHRALQIVQQERARAPGCSIAVLVASRAHAVPIAALLQTHGIAVRGLKLTPLAERHCVRDLLMLARALQHRGDRTAWLALLRSPLCGLELAELQAIAEDDTAPLWTRLADATATDGLSAATRSRLERLRAAMAPALAGSERQEPLSRRTSRVWLRLGGAELYSAPDERADASALLGALAAGPEVEQYSGEDFSTLLDDLYADSAGPDDAVQILTMHSAKGLEWDVVIVPGLHRATQHDSRNLLEWLALPREDRGVDLLFGPIDAAGATEARSLSSYIRGLRRRRRELERRRLLYVTATRARRALYWLGAARPAKDKGRDAGSVTPPSNSLLALLWPAIGEQFLALDASGHATQPGSLAAAASETPGDQRAVAAAVLERLPAEWQPPASVAGPSCRRLPIWLRESSGPEYAWVGVFGRAVGTVIHAELQRHASRQRTLTLNAGVESTTGEWFSAARYGAWLAELGLPASERAAGAERVVQTLQRTLLDERGRWLLSHAAHREASSERRLTGIYAGEVVNIVIDRMLVDAAGRRWVVDFKTGGHEGGDLQEFVDQEILRYRPQLQRYATLARHLGPEPVHCALYFPVLGIFREVPIDSSG